MPETELAVQPVVKAALLLTARSLCRDLGLPPGPSVIEILSATGASRSRAYEVCPTLYRSLVTLLRPRGRPSTVAPAKPVSSTGETVTASVLNFLLLNPGSAQGGPSRQRYSDAFCRFIIELREKHAELSLEEFAQRSQVPLGTLKTWLANLPTTTQTGQDDTSPESNHSDCEGETGTTVSHRRHEITIAEVEAIVGEWRNWRGTFTSFVDHLRAHLRISIGKQMTAYILAACNVRQPRRRQGRTADETALRGSFDTFFPGAQWVGDGKAVDVFINGDKHTVNLELNVDAHTGAWVGLSVRDEEDSAAVIEAFKDGVTTTGVAPIAELLDNKPCNHTPEVDAVLTASNTLLIRATPQRPENKAHVEGAFGLFSQTAPPIEINTHASSKDIARQLLLLVALTFACGINRRPRTDRDGRSRVQLYADIPDEEQVEQARKALKDRWRKQEKARATKEARQQPHIRELLDEHFEALGLSDPKRYIRLAIAPYPLDAIVDGIAIFTSKKQAKTLPDDADGRYLLGIVRNVAAQREGDIVAETLWTHRTRARDIAVALLQSERDEVCQTNQPAENVINDCIDKAMETERKLDRLFWLTAAVDYMKNQPPCTHRQLYNRAARCINTAFRVPTAQRQEAIVFLANRMVPLS